MFTSYHVHTLRSDGEANAADFVRAAIEFGLDEVGISDHYVMLAGGKSADWSMAIDELPAYCAELAELRDRNSGKIVVRYGLEADFDPATVDDLRDIIQDYPFDYVIGSVHFVDGFPVDKSREHWDALTELERNEVILAYIDRVAGMARTGVFDFVGHIDLYKKFGYRPTVDVSGPLSTTLDAVAAAGMPIEINTSGLAKDCREQYPSEYILRHAKQRGIPIMITGDAHLPEHLVRGYDVAVNLAQRAGYDKIGNWANRKLSFGPLDDASKRLA